MAEGADGRAGPDIRINILTAAEGKRAETLLREGFSGIYRVHALYTLRHVDVTLIASLDGMDAGVILLKFLGGGLGYIYYVAVAAGARSKGVGGALVDRAVGEMKGAGVDEIFAAREEGNSGAGALFSSRGFREVDMRSFRKRFGFWGSRRLIGRMRLVRGETLLSRGTDR